jgi:hypothetical protein
MAKGTITPKKLQQTQAALAELWTNTEKRQQFLDSSQDERADYGDLSGLSKSGIELYAELLQNNAQGLMASIFPACQSLFSDEVWTRTIESYLRECPPDTYHLNSLARKFSAYLKKHASDSEFALWPFIAELADFEWVELEVEEHPAKALATDYTELTSQELIATMIPVVNPAHTCRDYNYQVHEIARVILDDYDLELGETEEAETEEAEAEEADAEEANGEEHDGEDDDQIAQSASLIGSDKAAAVLQPVFKRPIHLVFFRDPESQGCRTLELGSAAQVILREAQSGTRTYADLLRLSLDGTPANALEEMLEKALAVFAKFHEAGLFVANIRR